MCVANLSKWNPLLRGNKRPTCFAIVTTPLFWMQVLATYVCMEGKMYINKHQLNMYVFMYERAYVRKPCCPLLILQISSVNRRMA